MYKYAAPWQFLFINCNPQLCCTFRSSSRFITPLVTLTSFTFALLHIGQREGWGRVLRLLALVFIVSLLFERVGVATGWVYGPYHYTGKLGPKFLGLVPYLLPAVWFMLSYPSFVIAEWLVPSGWKFWQRILAVAAVGWLVMTAWFVIMDPLTVAGGNWVWDAQGNCFGISFRRTVDAPTVTYSNHSMPVPDQPGYPLGLQYRPKGAGVPR